MAVNWFEGARRITALLQGGVALAGALYVLFGSSGNAVVFETHAPDENFRLTFEPCSYPHVRRNIGYKVELKRGDAREIELCFRQAVNGILFREDTRPVIQVAPPPLIRTDGSKTPAPPYRPPPPPKYFWAGDAYSPEVQVYMDRRVRIFRDAQYEWEAIARNSLLQGKLWRLWYRFKEAWPWVFGIVFFLWALSATLGWIIRGFAGIPTGKDFKEST